MPQEGRACKRRALHKRLGPERALRERFLAAALRERVAAARAVRNPEPCLERGAQPERRASLARRLTARRQQRLGGARAQALRG